ncbi:MULTISPECIES: ABC transporter substrate-binding protein [unclassified Bradyrhizobium]|uniref:ABC transporter substrate-binding protein n=1 Tax=unclassified Bradyrhizobium TaxID=2631580 RepID=UPI0015CA49CB|nr:MULTISPECIES: ABC transporter substrate-binding protein [unclassified Bradyrhizobium]MBB4260552.1 branched-chain amino acid transport system substrate-binding protein [Bradyrhizobium sp. CIR3A]NYG46822.1 branched-chain amino acid transport system substrate-binding protein [Bradyrhizobium sp. IAR9]
MGLVYRFGLGAVLALGAVGPSLAQTAGISDGVVKIGVLTDMSGQFSHESGEGSVTAVKMAVEDFGGSVLGKPIEVIVADHQNRNEVAIAKAREWYDVDKVDLIANLINSSIALAVTNVAKEKGRIAIVNGSGTSRLTGDSCTPNSIHYAYDTYALAQGTGKALIKEGLKSWYFLTADYAFGHALEADTSAVVKANGGNIAGTVRYPIDTNDHAAFLLQAQASKANVVAIAGSGTVFINALKSAREFGVTQTLAGLLVWITDIHSMGLRSAQGLVLTNAFYWDRDDETRAFAKRFFAKMKRMPHMGDAGDYSSTMHYLNAIKAAGTDDAKTVMAKMRELPVNDFFAKNGHIREDGRFVHDMYVYQVKKPEESKYEWDYYKLRAVIPGDEAFRPLSESKCPLIQK